MPAATPPPRRSLSWRLLGFTLAVMAATELLLFLPAMHRERQHFLAHRLVAAQIAVQALPTAANTAQSPVLPQAPDRAMREEMLRLAGVLSIRLQEPGRPMVVLAPVGQLHAPVLIDLRTETAWSGLAATLAALTRHGSRMVLVVAAASPKQPRSILSIVLSEAELDNHLRRAATRIALHGLVVAAATGALVYLALLLLLVRPMRRLTSSIAAFRTDPEHALLLVPRPAAPDTRDEIAMAQRELSAMQRELRAALWRNARLAALGAAVAKVSHDLRGILAPALLGAERLQGNTDPTLRRVGDSIARTVERATELMRNTLEFAREVPAAPRERIALRDLVRDVADEVSQRHQPVQVQIAIDDALAVHGDRASLRRVLANLISNAAEAGATSVGVAAAPEGGFVVLTIEDNGPGLPELVRSNLFHPFVTSGKSGGTGLGLAIARDLVRAQGGDVALLQTTAQGTTFRLALRTP